MSEELDLNELARLLGKDDDSALVSAARSYLEQRRRKEAAEDHLKAQTRMLADSEDYLRTLMAQSGVKSLKIENGDGRPVTLSATESCYYSAPPDSLDDAGFFAWLLRNGGHDMVKRQVHHATFSAFCRELVESGKSLPDRIKVVTRNSVRVKEG